VSPTLLPKHGVSLGPSPLHRLTPRRPLPRRCCHRHFGLGVPLRASCSGRVVSHHLAGFLRRSSHRWDCRSLRFRDESGSRGLVASRCRSWGSSRFSALEVWFPTISPRFQRLAFVRTTSTASPRRYLPLEGLLPPAAVPCHHGRCPLDVFFAPTFAFSSETVSDSAVPCAVGKKRRLQGFAPLVGPYHRSPYSSTRWPVLPGLFSPPRPFDRCATEAASRRMATRSTGGGIQSEDNPSVPLPALVEDQTRAWIRRAPLCSVLVAFVPTVEPSRSSPAPWAELAPRPKTQPEAIRASNRVATT